MHRLSLRATFISLALFSASIASACTDLILNKNEYITSARTVDFDKRLDSILEFFMPDVKNTSSIVIDIDSIPTNKIYSWTNKYGFVGLLPYNTSNAVFDGMNSEGVSVGALYQPHSSSYPIYNPLKITYK